MSDIELTRQLAERVMGWEELRDTQLIPLANNYGIHGDELFIWFREREWRPWHPLHSIGDAMGIVEHLHGALDPAVMGRYGHLCLVCTGHYGDNWCASFDHNLQVEWWEAVDQLPYAARSSTPQRAICLAALRVMGGQP